jgi:hypothetical protein
VSARLADAIETKRNADSQSFGAFADGSQIFIAHGVFDAVDQAVQLI